MSSKTQSKILQQPSNQIAAASFEANFAAKCWSCDTRADGREMDSFRDLTFSFDGERGHCLVTLGKTAVLATVQASLVTPSPFSPRHGFFEITSRVIPIDSKLDQRTLQNFLDRLYKNTSSPVIDVAGLCVVPGRVAWSIQVGVVVLADGGNVLDAASWACTGALSHFRRDEVAVSGDSVRRFSSHERDPVPFALLQMPISLTMLMILSPSTTQEPNVLCVDPSSVEEQCKSVTVTVGCNAEGQTCYFHGVSSPVVGGSSSSLNDGGVNFLTYADVKRARAETKKLAPQVLEVMKSAMKNDEEVRKKEALAKFEWAQQRLGVRQREN